MNKYLIEIGKLYINKNFQIRKVVGISVFSPKGWALLGLTYKMIHRGRKPGIADPAVGSLGRVTVGFFARWADEILLVNKPADLPRAIKEYRDQIVPVTGRDTRERPDHKGRETA